MAEIIFWVLLIIVFYSYFGYTVLIMALKAVKNVAGKDQFLQPLAFEPDITLVIAAYNEKEIITEKIANLRALDYPKEKLHILWVTDGSNDGSPDLLRQYPDMNVLHSDARNGKIGALNRAMAFVKTPIVVFCDANNILAPQSIRELVAPFANPKTGCVAGEKQILKLEKNNAAASGEGFYWKYESYVKKLESEIHSVVGAAGELFAIRKELYEIVEPDTLLDDFVISLRIVQKGYQIKYAPGAIAIESGSASIADEMKRKVRIAAGSLQTIPRLKALLNPFAYGIFSVQYWSHKILRWTAVPLCIVLLLPLNFYLAVKTSAPFYQLSLALQIMFYVMAAAGFILRRHTSAYRFIFVPYYLLLMNVAMFLGFIKHLRGKQSVNWEKAKRS